MIYSSSGKRFNIPTIKIKDTELEIVEQFNFLGLTIDKRLNWEHHINIVAKKISKINGIMNYIKHYVPKLCFKHIYNSLVLPHINYCILIWRHKNKRIFKLQKIEYSHYEPFQLSHPHRSPVYIK